MLFCCRWYQLPPPPLLAYIDKGSTCPYGEQKYLEIREREIAIMAVTDEGRAEMEPKQRQQKPWPSLHIPVPCTTWRIRNWNGAAT